eukprot:7972003-Alexandrium_andersonii.AAC.1
MIALTLRPSVATHLSICSSQRRCSESSPHWLELFHGLPLGPDWTRGSAFAVSCLATKADTADPTATQGNWKGPTG